MSNPSKVYLALVQAYAKAQLNRKNILTNQAKLGLVYPSIYYASIKSFAFYKHKGAPAKESFRYAQQLRSSKRPNSLNNKANTRIVWLKYKKNLAQAKPLLVGGVHAKHTRGYNFTKKNQNLISFLTFSEQSKEGRNWIFKRFMNPRTYDLGKQGRLNFNRKLGLSIASTQTTLTAPDVLYTTDYLLKLEKGLKNIDDIDHLKNRRVRTSGELLQIQIGIGLVRLEKMIRECLALKINTQNIKKYPSYSAKNFSNSTTVTQFSTTPFFFKQSLNHIINTKAFNGALREFFGTSQLSQFMDQLNPLAEITHKRRLSSMGPGGVTRDSATLAIRGIHPTHYGRICPIETPEGKNTGLVNSLTTYARANPQGFLESPFYRVYKGQIQKNDGIYFFSAEQEEKIKVAAADVSSFSGRIGFLPKSKIPAKIGYSDTISKISRNKVEYIGVSPIQMISIATSLIPFLEHDDANRALMGSNMQRQAVPLIRAERPLVGTGLESRTVSDSGHAVIAKESGYVAYVSAKKIVIYTIPSY
jgi:DNA-directed RNA polymerase subunit beta